MLNRQPKKKQVCSFRFSDDTIKKIDEIGAKLIPLNERTHKKTKASKEKGFTTNKALETIVDRMHTYMTDSMPLFPPTL